MRIERDELLRLPSSLGRMWLETDGEGGYASSTVLSCPTSRYHGLLIQTPPGSAKRHVFLSRFEEMLVVEGREFPLSTTRYGGGVVHPQGHLYVESFESTPCPTWVYRLGDVEVLREVQMDREVSAVLVRWRVRGDSGPYTLRLRPFLPCREADALTFENPDLDPTVHVVTGVTRSPWGVVARPYEALPSVSLTMNVAARFVEEPAWHRGIEFSDDLTRGYGGHEDQFTPGRVEVRLAPDREVIAAVTIGDIVSDPAATWRVGYEQRTRRAAARGVRAALARASGDFIHDVGTGRSTRTAVTAGFPWFGEWGRDACVALPGLTLTSDRAAMLGSALSGLARALRDGRLPNRIGPTPETSEYGAADPALWFARAVRLWDLAGEDERLFEQFLPALASIARGYRDSRAGDLWVDEAGLVCAKSGTVAATWMDAIVDGVPVTPRDGCAVEVNALWYFLLDYLCRLSRRREDDESLREFDAMRRRAGRAFLQRFWLEDESRLADCWSEGEVDRSVRPNMVIAAALEFSPLSRAQRAAVVDVARAELLTPRGLRTLTPRDPRYQGRYGGDVASRDAAYHQGTVWPWLLGSYAEACLRAHGRGRGVKQHIREILDGFAPHLEEGMLGQVAEVFDGDTPHRAGGAWAQAWSVAELLRAFALLEPRR